jgi:N-acylneuraminate cytidylyltransferase
VIKGERLIAVIPARGGSKSVPRKNIRSLGGRPLLAWSIESARQVREIDRIIVSTDDDQIAAVAREWGAEVYARPEHLARDHSLVIDALKDVVQRLHGEGEPATIMILLEPTCPFRSPDDISACVQFVAAGHDSAATFVEARVNPHRAWTIEGNRPRPFIKGSDPWAPRQTLPESFQLNGGVYVVRSDAVLKSDGPLLLGTSAAVVMPPDRSVDLDTDLDFQIAEALIANR